MTRMIVRILAASLIFLGGGPEAATPLIPVEEFARGPAVAGIQVSPSGDKMAILQTVDGRGAIVLADGSGKAPKLRYRDPERSISNVAWSGSGQWLYFFHDKGGDEGYHLFVLNPFTDEGPRDLTPFKGATAELIRGGSSPDTLLIALNHRDPAYPDAYSLNLATGKLTQLVKNPSQFTEFFAGGDGKIAAASAIESDGTLALHNWDGNAWHKFYSAGPSERMKVLAADTRPGHLIVRTNRDAAREELKSLSMKTGGTSTLVPHPCGEFDAEDVIIHERRLVGGSCYQEAATLWAISKDFRRALNDASALAGEEAGLWWESSSRDLASIVFFTNKGDDPGRYLIWRRGQGVQVLAAARPWLKSDQLAPTRARWIKARDGLPLLTYITRPNTGTKAGPAVIAIHGGPWSRDMGGFESETQLLANRGYTVVQVNFRGSTGLGKAIFEGGVGEFGRKMSDDIDDVATFLIEEGLIDKDRICLLGGSYGGYATLMGLVRRTLPYRCGINYAGPSDLGTLIGAFPPSWGPYLPRSWYRFVGNPNVPDQLREMSLRSPVKLASRITSPLLIFQGLNDPRVRKEQSDVIVCSLRKRGIEVDYLLATNEGHSFANEETRLAVNLAMEEFLSRHLGGRSQAIVEPTTRAAQRLLLANGTSQLNCGASSDSDKSVDE